MGDTVKKLNLFLTSIAIFLCAGSVRAEEYTNMVLVPWQQGAFYIDVFEATYIDFGEEHRSGYNKKPFRGSASQMQKYCEDQGKRLPTKAEWLAAATNLGANMNTTLIGDSFNKSKVTIEANGRSEVTEYDSVGIDAVGTVGLTGNVNEWVVSPDDSFTSCGGRWQSLEEEVHLSRICTPPRPYGTGGARCVVDYSDKISRINYNGMVKKDLKKHLQFVLNSINHSDLVTNFNDSEGGASGEMIDKKVKYDDQYYD